MFIRLGYNDIILVFFLWIIVSCSRDSDTAYPDIQVLSPVAGEEYEVPGKIHISAVITDDHTIDWVRIDLMNDNGQPVLPSLAFYPAAAFFELDTACQLDELPLDGGLYELVITAYDGQQTAKAFVPVVIAGILRELDRLVVLTRADDRIQVWSEKSGVRAWMFDVPGDYSGSAVSSRHQQLYITGVHYLNLACYDLQELMSEWIIAPSTDPPYHHPGDPFVTDHLVYVSFRQGMIRGYDARGILKFATPPTQQTEPAAILEHGEFLVADLKEKSGHDRYLACYHRSSGDERFRVKSGMEVVHFHPMDNHTIYAIGNIDSKGDLLVYNIQTNHLSDLHVSLQEAVLACLALDNTYLIIAGESNVYIYQLQTDHLNLFLPGISIRSIAYDEPTRTLFLASDHQITSYFYLSPVPIEKWDYDQEIHSFHLLHTK